MVFALITLIPNSFLKHFAIHMKILELLTLSADLVHKGFKVIYSGFEFLYNINVSIDYFLSLAMMVFHGFNNLSYELLYFLLEFVPG